MGVAWEDEGDETREEIMGAEAIADELVLGPVSGLNE